MILLSQNMHYYVPETIIPKWFGHINGIFKAEPVLELNYKDWKLMRFLL